MFESHDLTRIEQSHLAQKSRQNKLARPLNQEQFNVKSEKKLVCCVLSSRIKMISVQMQSLERFFEFCMRTSKVLNFEPFTLRASFCKLSDLDETFYGKVCKNIPGNSESLSQMLSFILVFLLFGSLIVQF